MYYPGMVTFTSSAFSSSAVYRGNYHWDTIPNPAFKEIDKKIKATGVSLNRAKMSKNKIAVKDITKTLDGLLSERKKMECWSILADDYSHLVWKVSFTS